MKNSARIRKYVKNSDFVHLLVIFEHVVVQERVLSYNFEWNPLETAIISYKMLVNSHIIRHLCYDFKYQLARK